MFEPDDQDSDIISSMVAQCVLEECICSLLGVVNVANKVNSVLITGNIPELDRPSEC